MIILRYGTRHFVADSLRDVHDVSLKLLNEVRMFENPGPKLDFINQVCADMDGETALKFVRAELDVRIIPVETL